MGPENVHCCFQVLPAPVEQVDVCGILDVGGGHHFNEGCDLEAAVEDYFRKFGCYPSAVLADRIYQTRRNKAYTSAILIFVGISMKSPPHPYHRAC